MQDRLKATTHLLRLSALWMAGGLLAGCCCTSRVKDVPFSVRDAGVEYQLVERLSIQKMLLDNGRDYRSEQSLIEALRRKFPKDTVLLAYLTKVEANIEKLDQGRAEFLRGIKADLAQRPGSALYYYKITYPKNFVRDWDSDSLEEGWGILDHGKVCKKYSIFFSRDDEVFNGAVYQNYGFPTVKEGDERSRGALPAPGSGRGPADK